MPELARNRQARAMKHAGVMKAQYGRSVYAKKLLVKASLQPSADELTGLTPMLPTVATVSIPHGYNSS